MRGPTPDQDLKGVDPNRWYRRIAVLAGISTFVLLTLPGAALASLGDLLAEFLPWSDASDTGEAASDKLVHAALFCVWAYSLHRGWPTASRLWLIAGLAGAALLTETLQTQIPGRTADLADGVADLGGAALGLAVGSFTFRRPKRRLSRPGEPPRV